MKERIFKYAIFLGGFLAFVFVAGLVVEIFGAIDRYINKHTILFTILVFGGVFLYLWLNKEDNNKTPKKYNLNQLLKELHFTIGEQYELNEFNLESKREGLHNDYHFEAYLYTKKDISHILGIEISRGILLLYNADILGKVFYRFKGDCFNELLSEINKYLPKDIEMIQDPFIKKREAYVNLKNGIILKLLVKENGDAGLCMEDEKYSKKQK